MSPAEIEAFLHEKIPLAQAMGVRVESSEGEAFILTAPLEPNHNHLGTAFGGSLAALATLTGYACLWHALDDRDAHVVIRRSELDYRYPVRSTLRAICKRPVEAKLSAFRSTFSKAGKARITLEVTIEQEGQVCLGFRGVFVAIR
ncbi:YiiD C-terminal domain-containing protein [Luteolibacter soli]|uniref:YiiD C-terminal domain-containing protein n=1 Tax=Luteolibacter soli TaxID=3135280 RepID=A0ABU9ARL0_9BACT